MPPFPITWHQCPGPTPWEPRRGMLGARMATAAQTYTGACPGKHRHLCADTAAHANVGSHGQPQTPTAPESLVMVEVVTPTQAPTLRGGCLSGLDPFLVSQIPPPPLSSQVWAERDCPTQLAVLLVPGKLGVKAGRKALFGR